MTATENDFERVWEFAQPTLVCEVHNSRTITATIRERFANRFANKPSQTAG